MLKPIMLVCMFLVCTFSGILKAYALKVRVRNLGGLIDFVDKISSEIKFLKKPVNEILKEECGKIPLFEGINIETGNTENLYVFAKSKNKDLMFFEKEDWYITDLFFASLGKSDFDSQLKLCDKILDSLKKQQKKAEIQNTQYSKMYFSTGILLGLFFVIILI